MSGILECAEKLCPSSDGGKCIETVLPAHCRRICVWGTGPEELVYQTGCGKLWQFEEGGPRENGVRYCPFCGLLLALPARQYRDVPKVDLPMEQLQ